MRTFSESDVVILPLPNRRFKDHSGKSVGMLTVIGFAGQASFRNGLWWCRCTCGRITQVRSQNLSGKTTSCGSCSRKTDDHATDMPEYWVWCAMVQRCTNPRVKHWNDYGGRGIRVCEAWLSFDAFIRDMGRRPTEMHQIDRYPNNDGNYEPSNCRWATPEENANNTRASVLYDVGSERLSLSQISRRTGISLGTLNKRIKLGWTIERAISEPINEKFRGSPRPSSAT